MNVTVDPDDYGFMSSTMSPIDTNCTIDPTATNRDCLYRRVEDMSAVDTYVFVLYLPVMSILAVLGLVGNTLAYIVMSKEMRQSSSTICLKALAVADNMVLVTYFIYFSPKMLWLYLGVAHWATVVSELIKPYAWAAVWFSKTLSVYIIVQMTIERYIAICQPLLAHRLRTESSTKLGILAIAVVDFVYNLPKVFQYDMSYYCDPCSGQVLPMTALGGLYNMYWYKVIYVKSLYFIVMFVFPLSVLFVLNILLINSIKRATRIREGMRTNVTSNDNVTEKIIGVVIAFLVLETPAVVLNVLYIFRDYEERDENNIGLNTGINYYLVVTAMRCLYVISSLNSCINFYIYCLVGRRFRRVLVHTLVNCGRDRSSPESSTSRAYNGHHLEATRTNMTKLSNSSLNAATTPRAPNRV